MADSPFSCFSTIGLHVVQYMPMTLNMALRTGMTLYSKATLFYNCKVLSLIMISIAITITIIIIRSIPGSCMQNGG